MRPTPDFWITQDRRGRRARLPRSRPRDDRRIPVSSQGASTYGRRRAAGRRLRGQRARHQAGPVQDVGSHATPPSWPPRHVEPRRRIPEASYPRRRLLDSLEGRLAPGLTPSRTLQGRAGSALPHCFARHWLPSAAHPARSGDRGSVRAAPVARPPMDPAARARPPAAHRSSR